MGWVAECKQPTRRLQSAKMFWLYTQAGQVIYASEGRRNQNVSYIYLNGSQIAMRSKAFTTGTVTVRYQMTDAFGSPVASTNTNGGAASIQRTSYTPWGEASPSVDGTGYTGHVMDSGTGLTYMQQRYYDPMVGRFLSVDPVKTDMVTGKYFARYAYAGNSPYSRFDPDGRRDIYIGGAGDKDNTKIVQDYAENQQKLHPERDVQYVGASEGGKLNAAIKAPLAKGEPLNIIGHSMGASSGVHAANANKVKITNLITIDPVGAAGNGSKPANVSTWLSVTASPSKRNQSDVVASLGRSILGATLTGGADTNLKSTANHAEFGTMMNELGAEKVVDSSYGNQAH